MEAAMPTQTTTPDLTGWRDFDDREEHQAGIAADLAAGDAGAW
jgi:hypothetical protein